MTSLSSCDYCAPMQWIERLSFFTPLDALGLLLLFLGWLGIGWITENPPESKPSVSRLMVFYRYEWMRQFILRQPRIYDAQILSNLRQGTAFFISATMLSIGGGLALIGNAESLTGVASDLTLVEIPKFVWEAKLIVVLIFVTNSFLKFVWSHRLFGYAAVIMSAVPVDPEDEACLPRAEKAGDIHIAAARSYNRGLRSIYFALAAACWLGGSWALIAAALLTIFIVWRREFASVSRKALLKPTR